MTNEEHEEDALHLITMLKYYTGLPEYDEKIKKEYLKFLTLSGKEKINEVLRYIENKFCKKHHASELYVDFDGTIKPIGKWEAAQRNKNMPTTQMLRMIRQELDLMPKNLLKGDKK